MAVVEDQVIFRHDGREYHPIMVWDDDDDEPRPVVMVCGTIRGRDSFAVDRARALQQLGYVGVALDVYGEGFHSDDAEVARVHMNRLTTDREALRQCLDANIEFITTQPNVDSMKMVVIGYCFGGLCALDVARSRDDVLAVASFHGILIPPPRTLTSPINAKVLVLHGNEDPLVPPAQVDALRDELTQRSADWQVHTYGFVYHSFAVPSANAPDKGLQFNDHAQARSWQSLVNFLQETF